MITNVTLTTKEKNLLEDQKKDEQLCIQKYGDYANLATDSELKNLFNQNKKQEEQHLQTINQLLKGEIPPINNQQSGNNSKQSSNSNSGSSQSTQVKNALSLSSDKNLCSDLLMTEKYVSGAYNTAVFEFRNPAIRDVLNHIQTEEQKHGESIYKYMESKGMYNAQ